MPVLRLTVHFRIGMAIMALMAGISVIDADAAPVIALFTDYGGDDPYVSQVEGAILTADPNARILDLTHSTMPFSVAEGAYLLDQCAEEFPTGTVFVALVEAPLGMERDPILLETTKGKFFIGPDNGLFTDVIDREGLSKAWKLDKLPPPPADGRPSHGRDIFAPVAAHMANGDDPERFGTPIKTLVLLPVKEPSFSSGTVSVEVLHIDRSGNVILNLRDDGEMAAKLKEGNLVKISIGKESHSGPLVKSFGDVEKGRMLLFYGSNGLLEISMNPGSAAKELKVEPGTVIFLKP